MSQITSNLFWLQVACVFGVACGIVNWVIDPTDVSDNFLATVWPAVAFFTARASKRMAEAMQ